MSEYEFTSEEGAVFETLARRMAHFGLLVTLVGVARFLQGAVIAVSEGVTLEAVVALVQAAVLAAMGVAFYRPAGHLKRIATTSGADISELMIALREVGGGLGVVLLLVAVNALLIVVNIVGLFVL